MRRRQRPPGWARALEFTWSRRTPGPGRNKEGESEVAKLQHGTLSNRMIGRLEGGEGHRVLGQGTYRLRREGLSHGLKSLRHPGPGTEGNRVASRWDNHGVINADEARRRAASIIARVKAGDEAVSSPVKPAGGPTVGELAQRYMEEHVAVRCKPGSAKLARSVVYNHIVPALGRPAACVGRARAGRGTAPAAVQDALYGEHGGPHPEADVQARRGMGHGPQGMQPVPFHHQVPRSQTRTLPDRQGVHPPRTRPRRGGKRKPARGVGDRSGGDPPSDADRVPEERDTDASLGERVAG